MKKLFSIILCLVMVLSAIPAFAAAGDAYLTAPNGQQYTININNQIYTAAGIQLTTEAFVEEVQDDVDWETDEVIHLIPEESTTALGQAAGLAIVYRDENLHHTRLRIYETTGPDTYAGTERVSGYFYGAPATTYGTRYYYATLRDESGATIAYSNIVSVTVAKQDSGSGTGTGGSGTGTGGTGTGGSTDPIFIDDPHIPNTPVTVTLKVIGKDNGKEVPAPGASIYIYDKASMKEDKFKKHVITGQDGTVKVTLPYDTDYYAFVEGTPSGFERPQYLAQDVDLKFRSTFTLIEGELYSNDNPKLNQNKVCTLELDCTRKDTTVAGMPKNVPAKEMTFPDVKTTDWFYTFVQKAYSLDLVAGKTNGFAPTDNISLAECVTLATKMNLLYRFGDTDISHLNVTPGCKWYDPYFDYALENKIIEADWRLWRDMNLKVDRLEFVRIFYKALPDYEYDVINSIAYDSIPDMDESYSYLFNDFINAVPAYVFYRAGIIAGDKNHYFNPYKPITRAEVSVIVANMLDKSMRGSLTLE